MTQQKNLGGLNVAGCKSVIICKSPPCSLEIGNLELGTKNIVEVASTISSSASLIGR